jgi:hypothetical protein
MYWQVYVVLNPACGLLCAGFLLIDSSRDPRNNRLAADPAGKDIKVREAALYMGASEMSSTDSQPLNRAYGHFRWRAPAR